MYIKLYQILRQEFKNGVYFSLYENMRYKRDNSSLLTYLSTLP